MGFRPSFKKANKSGHVPGSGSDSFPAGLGSDLSGQGIFSPSAATEDFSPVPKAMGSPVWSSGVPVASPIVVPPPSVEYASVGSGFEKVLLNIGA
jgi:hypothetical protein